MILVCPECSTQYEIPTALPEEGTKVRCTSCAHVWMATADDVFENEALADAASNEAKGAPDDDFGIPPISPNDEDPLEELDFEEVDAADKELDQSELDSLFDEVEPEVEAEDNSQGDIDSLFDEVEEPEEENSQGDIDSLFDEMGGDSGEDNSQDDIDGLFDEPEAEGDENSQDDIDGLFDEPEAAGEDNSQDDIDGLFDEPASSEEPVAAAPEEDLVDPFDSPLADDTPDIVMPNETPPVAVAAKLPIWKRMGRNEMIGWGCYSLTVVLVFSIMIMARVSVVRSIPSMAGVYSTFGMNVNVRGLAFTNVQQKWEIEDNRLILKVHGEITNLTNKYKKMPPMIFGAVSSRNKEVFRWVMNVRKKPLLPGEKAPFMANVPLPPEQAKHLYISFQ